MKILLACALLIAARSFADEPSRPFPQHTTYTAGSIRPRVPQAELDAAVAKFYDAWKARYLHAALAPGQLYVAYNLEKNADDPKSISVSEGHGYGMLLAAFMAGHDPAAHSDFDQLFAWFRAHPSGLTPGLMSWRQLKGDLDRKGDDDSATDGDLDIAYALLLADAQWGSAGAIAYRAEALKVIAAITAAEINPKTLTLQLGDWVAGTGSKLEDTRLSDLMPGHFRAFHAATKDAIWLQILDRAYAGLAFLQSNQAPDTGLLPDFATHFGSDTSAPAPRKYLESKNDGDFSYNACRLPWRIATDYLLTGDARAKTVLEKIDTFIEHATAGDPESIRAGYRLATGALLDRDDTSLAFTAPFAVAAMIDARHQVWLDALWKKLVSAPIESDDYYGNTIKLLCLIVLSGNWWSP